MICVLEDNADRVQQFERAVALMRPPPPVKAWASAPAMMADLVDRLQNASLISLDHDLIESEPGGPECGTGYDLAKFLAELIPCCPVIVHTSNGERGTWMAAALIRAGWQVDRVYPFGDDWIERDWLPIARRRLGL